MAVEGDYIMANKTTSSQKVASPPKTVDDSKKILILKRE